MKKINKKYIEELLRIALQREVASKPMVYEGSPCLSNETIDEFYTGKISDENREEAYSHLVECDACRMDLGMYIDLMESQKGKESS